MKRNISHLDMLVEGEREREKETMPERKNISEWHFDRKLFFHSLFIFLSFFPSSWALVVSPIRCMNVRHFLTIEQVDLHTSLRRKRKTYKWNGNCFLWNLWHLTYVNFFSSSVPSRTHESVEYTMSPNVEELEVTVSMFFVFFLSLMIVFHVAEKLVHHNMSWNIL